MREERRVGVSPRAGALKRPREIEKRRYPKKHAACSVGFIGNNFFREHETTEKTMNSTHLMIFLIHNIGNIGNIGNWIILPGIYFLPRICNCCR